MSARTNRPYRGAEDLRKMQALVSAAYEQTDMRVGDVAWLARVHTQRELGLDIRLWEEGDALIGWSFFRSNGGFNVFAVPGITTDSLIDEMLATVEGMAREAIAVGDAMISIYTYGVVPGRSELDQALATGLERNGFKVENNGGGVSVKNLTTFEEPSVPPGYLLATVDTTQRIRGRVEAHRAAFAPSEMTSRMYERVRCTWPYRQDLDVIVETQSGDVVAFCTAWFDEVNAAGLLEPVGTHPDHQRHGLARAACRAALNALRNVGALTAQVGFGTPEARALYESLGFVVACDEGTYKKDLL